MFLDTNGKNSIRVFFLFICIIIAIGMTLSVKQQDFRTCTQTSFCRRNRAYADKATSSSFSSPYIVVKDTVNIEDGIISGELINSESKVSFIFEIHLLINNV